jgi:hypothetical protein
MKDMKRPPEMYDKCRQESHTQYQPQDAPDFDDKST